MPVRRRLVLALSSLSACPGDAGEPTTASTGTTGDATSSPTGGPPGTTGPDDPTTGSTGIDPPTTLPPTSGTTDDPGPTTDPTDDTTTGPTTPEVILPRAAITASELAILANDQDPQSMAVAAYYQQARQIPAENVVTLSFPVGNSMDPATFAAVQAQLAGALGPQIQGYAIAWTTPYLVDCQSLASALAVGAYDKAKYCSSPCSPTAPSGYYDSPSFAPFTDHALRPAMHLAGVSAEEVYKVIDRGVASDGTFPTGVGHLVRTTDADRSVRWPDFQISLGQWDHPGGLLLEYLDNSGGAGLNYIENEPDVLFYLTGLADVPQIATNTFLPGAVADHLTSYGGQIPQSGQMSVVRWLEAGATASYGTGVEPCNYPTKFPNSLALLPHYFRGETVLEAYWKSVDWPGEGVFVGEPLARPWGGAQIAFVDQTLSIKTTQLVPGNLYDVQSGPSADGPWTSVLEDFSIAEHQLAEIVVPAAGEPFYRVIPSI
jgi:uncharacterized protein (TIGR03790 family)